MNFNKIISFISINLFFLSIIPMHGSVVLYDSIKRIDITQQFEIFEDGENKISSNQITSGKYDSIFSTNKIETKLFHNQKRTFWARLKTESKSNNNTEWYLRFWNIIL